MEFIPETEKQVEDVPYFEDVNMAAGWGGHTTQKGEIELQSQIAAAMGRLGGMVTGWQKGTVIVSKKSRDAYRMFYTIQQGEGKMLGGRMDIAALPVRTKASMKSHQTKRRQALRMALYNLRNQLEAAWRMQQLIPGYFALLPFMLHESGKTFTELWVSQQEVGNLLPEVTEDHEDALDIDFKEIKKE